MQTDRDKLSHFNSKSFSRRLDRNQMPIQLLANTAVITGQETTPVRRGLTSRFRRFVPQNGSLSESMIEQHAHFWDLPTGGIEIPIGLAPRAERVVRVAGLNPLLIGNYLRPSDRIRNIGLDTNQSRPDAIRSLSEAFCTHRQGQVIYHTPGHARDVLATLIETFADHRILFVARRRRELRGLARRLTGASGVRVYADIYAASADPRGKLVVSSFRFGSMRNPDDNWAAIVFLSPDAIQGHSIIENAGWHANRSLMYCLRPAWTKLSLHEELQIEYCCGPVIHEYAGHEQRASVQVLMVDGSHRPVSGILNRESPAVELKRGLYWRSGHRNELVATLATALRTGDQNSIIPHIPALRRPDPLELALQQPTVSVLVQNREHALELQKLLPEWPIVSSNSAQLPGVCCIVTEPAASRLEITSGVLINASGNELGAILFPARVQSQYRVQSLVDFTDTFHSLAGARSTARVQQYHAANYDIQS